MLFGWYYFEHAEQAIFLGLIGSSYNFIQYPIISNSKLLYPLCNYIAISNTPNNRTIKAEQIFVLFPRRKSEVKGERKAVLGRASLLGLDYQETIGSTGLICWHLGFVVSYPLQCDRELKKTLCKTGPFYKTVWRTCGWNYWQLCWYVM